MRTTYYTREIQRILDARGWGHLPAGAVEYLMRLEHSTLDALPADRFAAEVAICVMCVLEDPTCIDAAAREGYCEARAA